MKRMMFWVSVLAVACLFASAPTITEVTARQRYPWNGKVDISYKVTGDIAAAAGEYGCMASLKITALDKTANDTYTATALSGDTSLSAGVHVCVWDLDAQGLSFKSTNVAFRVACDMKEWTYCVIDLAGDSSDTRFPVTYMNAIPGGDWSDEYKTTKLVLKRVSAGTFIMGEDQTDESHRVTLTKSFYMGVFEVTQKQWELVMGGKPSVSSSHGEGATYSVYRVSYNMIRGGSEGTKWPSSSSVDPTSFIGKLRAKTGITAFDLPTEAQWEFACRAGTTTAYNYGNDIDGTYMWYSGNSDGKVHAVGEKKPNQWGLYDMHGNVYERCLDWYGDSLAYGTDPKGPSSGELRVLRGGGWRNDSDMTDWFSYHRGSNSPFGDGDNTGFRLSRTLP